MPNLSRNSFSHCSHRCGGHRTPTRLAAPLSSSSRATKPASMVFPTPTSSAMSMRTGFIFRDIAKGTYWYGRGAKATLPTDRNGPAPALRFRRKALRSRLAPERSPAHSGAGLGYADGLIASGSMRVYMPILSSSEPSAGRSNANSS